jgi:hypothetical protein
MSQALEAEGGGPETDITILELSNQLKGYDYCVGLVFLVSLAAFPGMVACICSVQNGATVAPCLSHPPAGRFYGDSLPRKQNLFDGTQNGLVFQKKRSTEIERHMRA